MTASRVSLERHGAEWVSGVGCIPGMRRAVPSKASFRRDTNVSMKARREREQQGIVRVEDYEWLVGFHAKRYVWATRTGAMCHDDIMQAGRMGLMRAAETFEQRGLKFETYARWWVLQTIQRACTEMGRCVRIPPNEYWEQRKGKKNKTPITGTSLDKPILRRDGGREVTRKDLLKSEQDAEADILERDAQRERERVVAVMFERLTERERDVLMSRAKGMTLEAIGDQYGISRERVRQVESHAQEKCRNTVAAREYREGL